MDFNYIPSLKVFLKMTIVLLEIITNLLGGCGNEINEGKNDKYNISEIF